MSNQCSITPETFNKWSLRHSQVVSDLALRNRISICIKKGIVEIAIDSCYTNRGIFP